MTTAMNTPKSAPMSTPFTETQDEMVSAARSFLSSRVPMTRVRELATCKSERAIDPDTWRQCAGLGWLSLGLPAATGGLELGTVEEFLLFRELGRHLTPGPFLGTVLAGHVAVAAGEAELATALACGDRRAGLRVDGLGLDAHEGDIVISFADGRARLSEVLNIRPVRSVDDGVRVAAIEVGPALAEVTDTRVLTRARVLAAAELVGIIEAVTDMSVHYASERVQFGRPIGAFQAVKHRCADMMIGGQATLAQVLFAATYLDHDQPDSRFHGAAAYVVAAESARKATADNIQNHGAMGFTAEHDAHLFVRRGLVLERALSPLRAAMADVLAPDRHEFR